MSAPKAPAAAEWATLFRHLSDALGKLAAHPFVMGDAEAERRLDHVLRSATLEDMDSRMDHLNAYLGGKLDFNLALRAMEAGEEAPAPARPVHTGPPDAGNTRRITSGGPSGEDFSVQPDAEQEKTPVSRGFLRL